MRALLIARNPEEKDFLGYALRHTGLQTIVDTTPKDAVTDPMEKPFDVIVLAVPSGQERNGLETVRHIRARRQTPLHLITDQLTEKLHCDYLDAGVDCVLQRPISMPLFTRYTKMLLRRAGSVPATVLATIESDGIALDPSKRTVQIADHTPQRLTQLEFRLLYMLMTNAGTVVPTEELVERVWGYSGDGNRDLVRGLVRRLRKKIEPGKSKPFYIHNLPGIGYEFELREKG